MLNFLNNSKRRKVQVPEQVGCVGKFPVDVEFIRCGNDAGLVKLVDDWLQKLLVEFHQQHEQSQKFMPNHYFLSLNGWNGLPLLGQIVSSEDKSGRHYPFILYRLLEHEVALEFKELIPCIYQPFFTTMDDLSGLRSLSLSQFRDKVLALGNVLPQQKRVFYLEQAITSLKVASFSSFINGLSQFEGEWQLFAYVQKQMSALQQRTQDVIKLPLPINHEACHVLFWLQLLASNPMHENYLFLWPKASQQSAWLSLCVRELSLVDINVFEQQPHIQTSHISYSPQQFASLFDALMSWSKQLSSGCVEA